MKCPVVSRFRTTLGLPGRLATRLQPNHPTDDLTGIAASVVDGLLMGAGDAVIGVNPASDNVAQAVRLLYMLAEVIERHDIPTQSCVLTHVTNTMKALEQGARVDLVFQSIAGIEAANPSFGVSLALLDEAHDAARALQRGTVGDQAPVAPRAACTTCSVWTWAGASARRQGPRCGKPLLRSRPTWHS